LLAFLAYAFGKRRGFGLGAAFLVALIPTTVRFLGPAFLVPVALGLTFIPLTLLTLQRLMFDLRGPVVLFLIFVSLLFIHPPTLAVISGIAVIHFILFSLPAGERGGSRAWQSVVALALLLSVCVLTFFWVPSALDFVTREAMDPEAHLAASPIGDALPKFGYVPVALFVMGAGILIYRGKRHDWALVLSAAGLLAFEQIYPRFYIGPDIVYERGWLYTYVLMALLGGVALRELARGARVALLKRRPAISAAASYALIGVIVVLALTVSMRSHLSEQYDHVIDDAAYQDFLWVGEYVPAQYGIGVLDTFVAWPFASVSGKFAYTAEIAPNLHAEGRSAMKFLQDGASDTSWLKERGITIVCTPWGVENNELIKVHNNVYLLVE